MDSGAHAGVNPDEEQRRMSEAIRASFVKTKEHSVRIPEIHEHTIQEEKEIASNDSGSSIEDPPVPPLQKSSSEAVSRKESTKGKRGSVNVAGMVQGLHLDKKDEDTRTSTDNVRSNSLYRPIPLNYLMGSNTKIISEKSEREEMTSKKSNSTPGSRRLSMMSKGLRSLSDFKEIYRKKSKKRVRQL